MNNVKNGDLAVSSDNSKNKNYTETASSDTNEQALSNGFHEKAYSDTSRLLIFFLFSFGLTFLWYAITAHPGETWSEISAERQSLLGLGMLFPMIAHLLTRMITKEGFPMTGEESLLLGISFRNRKWIYYLLASLLPWVYTELGFLIAICLNRKLYAPNYYLTQGLAQKYLLLLSLNAIISGILCSFAALGEEGGWRCYMMPKLFKLKSRPKAFLIGGVIWGLWHAPLTCIGHNFGTEYRGFPYLGIIMMCLYCILMGILLTFITEKSGSIWPATILHSTNNAQPSILFGFINPDKVTNAERMAALWGGRLVSVFVTAVVIMIVWHRISKPKTTAGTSTNQSP